MAERDWWLLTEALAWIVDNAHCESPLRGPHTQIQAWILLRAAAADGRVGLRGVRTERQGNNAAWHSSDDGRLIPAEVIEPLWPVVGHNGTIWLTNETVGRSVADMGLLPFDRFPAVYWTSVTVSRRDVLKSFSQDGKHRPGRKVSFHLEELRREAHRLLDHHGDFTLDDPDWNSQETLIRALQTAYEKEYGREPSRTTLQNYLGEWISDWRSRKKATN